MFGFSEKEESHETRIESQSFCDIDAVLCTLESHETRIKRRHLSPCGRLNAATMNLVKSELKVLCGGFEGGESMKHVVPFIFFMILFVAFNMHSVATTTSYNFDFTAEKPHGVGVIFVISRIPADIGWQVGEGLYITDKNSSKYNVMYTFALPHTGQSYTADYVFECEVADTGATFAFTAAIASTNTADKLYFVAVKTSGLEVECRNFTNALTYTLASTGNAIMLQNNVEYRLYVEVTYGAGVVSVYATLYDASDTALDSISTSISDAYPICGAGASFGATQTGTIYIKSATISFTGEPNVLTLKGLLDPYIDYDTDYDWIGAPMRVWYQHSDGKFYPYDESNVSHVVFRVHGEASGTGDRADMYKIVGDPRNPSSYVFEKTVFERAAVGWDLFEEFNLIILNNGTWIAFAAGGAEYSLHRLISNDGGLTWVVQGTILSGKLNHLWIEEDGTLIMCKAELSVDTIQVMKSTDLGKTWTQIASIDGYRCGSIYKVGDTYYLVASHVATTDSNNYAWHEAAIYTSTDLLQWDYQYTLCESVEELSFTLYQGAIGYPELIYYNNAVYLLSEWSLVDHHEADVFNDQKQRHVAALGEVFAILEKH